ncbi:MAG TPA: amidase [Kofleriaceae bacterium]|nr:amidase [Kofleriaceae bacterium]
MEDLLRASALELARRVRAREVSAEELARAYLARIARIDPQVSAFTHVLARAAIADARRKDAALARRRAPDPLPPFWGVPVAVKDLNFVRGSFTRLGSRAFRLFYSPFDDKVVQQLRLGGFVIVGKVSTAELGALPVTEPDIHPPTRNPWDLGVTPGGSSGGSAAAVAAGMVPIAQGSDGAGSIRIPSALCHLVGIKPSRGRVVDPYGRPDADQIATCGPIARSVDDAAAMLDVMAGLSVGKPHWAPRPDGLLGELARREPRRLRVRVTVDSPLVTPHAEVAAAVARVAAALEGMGHEVEEAGGLEAAVADFLPIWQYNVSRAPVLRPRSLQPVTAWLRAAGRTLRVEDVLARQRELAARVLDWFGDVDVWVTPTVAVPPPAIGAWKGMGPAETFDEAAKLGAFTAVFNVTGQPAASVPVGVATAAAGGWPIGVQVAGRLYEDATVLAVSRQLESAMPWAARRAPIAG